jgi:16S rRNA (cytosine1402-N4)-methyltransferase
MSGHAPVLLAEAVAACNPRDCAVIVDGTFGGGGYSEALMAAGARVIGLDRDPAAVARGRALEREAPAFTMVETAFSGLEAAVADLGLKPVDAVVLDIGVSSYQFDEGERGFSFRFDGPLDMRMSGEGPSAADAVNRLSEADLADVLYVYGEERQSRRIAKAIVARRRTAPFARTLELAELIEGVIGRKPGDTIHPATRSFQALRIFVNDELGELEAVLGAAEAVLKPGGRLAVVTFHSLEDRIVKRFLQDRSGAAPAASRHVPDTARPAPTFRLVGRKPVEPSPGEVAANPRARSARLRAAERTDAPARGSAAGLAPDGPHVSSLRKAA